MSARRTTRKSQPPAAGASIYEVARRANVSIVTVSRVFNDYPHVSRRMRARVFEAARAAGYTPRLVSKPNVLAAIVGHLDNLSAGDYKTRLLLYIVQAAARVGYLVEFIPADMNHRIAQDKALKKGQPPPTDFRGAAASAF